MENKRLLFSLKSPSVQISCLMVEDELNGPGLFDYYLQKILPLLNSPHKSHVSTGIVVYDLILLITFIV